MAKFLVFCEVGRRMLKRNWVLYLWLCTQAAFSFDFNAYEAKWNQLIQQPHALQEFLNKMPKGADLHLHASGAVSTEKLVELAKTKHYCINKQFEISEPIDNKCSHAYFTDYFFQSPYYRQKAVEAWSMQNFHQTPLEDNKTHFFKTFEKFSFLPAKSWPKVIADVVDKAHDQHIQYLELMVSMHGKKPSISFSAQKHHIGDVLHDKNCQQYIKENIQYFRGLKKQVQAQTPWLGEDVDVSWILEIKRNQSFDEFWVDAVMVYAIANRVHDIVAVNMVQPEYDGYAQSDYIKQMQFLHLLSQYFPNVKLVLHAGEVPTELVNQDGVSHLQTALDYLEPKRIGHGTDLMHEKDPGKILSLMKNKDIAVEINLTSNEQILEIKLDAHPLRNYLKGEVPVVISSDDPGVSRNDLSHEYFKAITEQHMSLKEMIQANRNSLTYSLLQGKSIWENSHEGILVKNCTNLNSVSCLRFVSKNTKAYHQWLLEQDLKTYFDTWKF